MTRPTIPHGASECHHMHGDFVIGMWVCGQCYSKLRERPHKLGKAVVPLTERKHMLRTQEARQELIWQAEIRKTAEGTTLAQFLRSMVRRFQHRSPGISETKAYGAAIAALREYGVEFGSVGWDWSRTSARDIADEEMAYWEENTECNG